MAAASATAELVTSKQVDKTAVGSLRVRLSDLQLHLRSYTPPSEEVLPPPVPGKSAAATALECAYTTHHEAVLQNFSGFALLLVPIYDKKIGKIVTDDAHIGALVKNVPDYISQDYLQSRALWAADVSTYLIVRPGQAITAEYPFGAVELPKVTLATSGPDALPAAASPDNGHSSAERKSKDWWDSNPFDTVRNLAHRGAQEVKALSIAQVTAPSFEVILSASIVDGGIGLYQHAPWPALGAHTQRFKELTTAKPSSADPDDQFIKSRSSDLGKETTFLKNAVIMGRNAFLNCRPKLGLPVPGCLNVVITQRPAEEIYGYQQTLVNGLKSSGSVSSVDSVKLETTTPAMSQASLRAATADLLVFSNLDDAVIHLDSLDYVHKIYVIGGYQLFKAALASARCRRVHMTHVCMKFPATVALPILSETFVAYETERMERVQMTGPNDTIPVQFEVLKRKSRTALL